MDQEKIGKFISECRKDQNLTQSQLAEKLGITDKAISKWERGRAMPDVSIMIDLCQILKINVQDLLCGEKTNMENNQNNEELLLKLAKEIKQKDKIIWTSMWVIMIVSMVSLFAGIVLVALFVPKGIWQIVGMLSLCVVFLIPCFYALKLEVSVGKYKCKNCGHEFIPTYSEALWAMHAGTTRHLKCPKCQKRSWCKKIIEK